MVLVNGDPSKGSGTGAPAAEALTGVGLNQAGGFFKLFDFFLPRMVTLTPPFPCLPPQSILNISNNNYCPITVTQLTVEVLHLSFVVGQVSHSLLLHIGPLASEQVTPSRWPAPHPTSVWTQVGGRGQLQLGLTL